MDLIEVRNTPLLTGLTFRNFRGEGDYSHLAAVLSASEAVDHSPRQVNTKAIAEAYQNLTNCQPLRDVLFVEVAGKVVGYARVWWEDDPAVGRIYHHNGFLVPEWRRKGIGRAMVSWIEDHCREDSVLLPSEVRRFLQTTATQFQAGANALMGSEGYHPVRIFYEMVRPSLNEIVEFPLPEGLEIRPVEVDHYRAIWNSVDETSMEEWGYKAPSEEDYQEWLQSEHFQPHLWQVAWDLVENRVIGHVLTYIDQDENEQSGRKRGYTEGIGVDSAWRRKGVARALISRSLQAQKAAGMSESALVADSDSTSNVIQLYQSCGFQVVKYETIYRKPL